MDFPVGSVIRNLALLSAILFPFATLAQPVPLPTVPVVTAPLTVVGGIATLGAGVIVNELLSPRPFSDDGAGKQILNATGAGLDHGAREVGKIFGLNW